MNLIINPNWREAKEVGRMCSVKNPSLPIELLYISDDLKRNGIENELLDLWAENKKIEAYKEKILNSDFIVLTTAPSYPYWRDGTLNADLPKKIIKKIRNISKETKIILIGPHSIIEKFSDVDFVVKGEPELVISKIIKKEDVDIDNDYTVANLDDLPCLTFSQVRDLTKYDINPSDSEALKSYEGPSIFYEASRGCIYNCIFCFRKGFRDKFRKKSLVRIEKEIKMLKERGVKFVFLIDECFGIDNHWAFDVGKIIKRNNIQWGCQFRSDMISEDWIDSLVDNNCKSVYVGLESVNREIAKILGKSFDDLDAFKKNLDYMVGKGLKVFLSCIIGSPNETKGTIKELKDFLLGLPLDKISADAYTLLPYPNTHIWQMGINEGKNLKSWSDVKKYAGTIGNSLRQSYIKRQERRINLLIDKKQNKNIFKIPLYYVAFIAPNIILPIHSFFNNKRW